MSLRTIIPCPGLCALALVAASCVPLGTTPGSKGELGNGLFSYRCASDSDPVCDDMTVLHEVPKAVAVGSRFEVIYTPSGGDGNKGSASVVPASEELIIQTGGIGSSFEAVKPGTAALLATRGSVIVDFVHVRMMKPAGVRVDVANDPESDAWSTVKTITIPLGEEMTIRAAAVSEADELLAGAFGAAWTSEDDAVAKIVTLTTDNRIKVHAKSLGETKLRVSLGDLGAEFTVEVVKGPNGAGGAGGAGGQGGDGGKGGAGGGA